MLTIGESKWSSLYSSFNVGVGFKFSKRKRKAGRGNKE